MNISVDNKSGTHIINVADESWEHHWEDAPIQGLTLVASHCPLNWPSISVFTMTNKESKESIAKLLTEGWEKRK
jgi:hypothetical protein